MTQCSYYIRDVSILRAVVLGVKAAGAYCWQPTTILCAVVTKSGKLNFLETSGPVQACNGTALPFCGYVYE